MVKSSPAKVKIAVLVSGGGTNLQALINACRSGVIANGEIVVVISNKRDAYALERAKDADIPARTVIRSDYSTQEGFEGKILEVLEKAKADMIVLAGFLSILSKDFTDKYAGRIINVHPSLIPSFCGQGFYGLKVHEAALNYGVKVTGATVHYVNEVPDGGQIIMQKAVDVEEDDTPESLQKRVMEQAEWIIMPLACEKVCKKILEEKKNEENKEEKK